MHVGQCPWGPVVGREDSLKPRTNDLSLEDLCLRLLGSAGLDQSGPAQGKRPADGCPWVRGPGATASQDLSLPVPFLSPLARCQHRLPYHPLGLGVVTSPSSTQSVFSNRLPGRKGLTCSTRRFPSCKATYHAGFQAASAESRTWGWETRVRMGQPLHAPVWFWFVMAPLSTRSPLCTWRMWGGKCPWDKKRLW